MSTIPKTIVATGASSGLGFELVKQLLAQKQPYRLIFGARNTKAAQAAVDGLKYDGSTHQVTILPAELSNMNSVKTFAQQVLDKLGDDKVDYLMLNAATGTGKREDGKGPHGSKWCDQYLVNHLSQHYLIHLLRQKLEQSKSRIVVISSGAVRVIKDPNVLEEEVSASGKYQSAQSIYCATKFIQLLGAQWWRRELLGTCTVVATSPGLIPGTSLFKDTGISIPSNSPDAKPVSEGAKSMFAAYTRDDIPEDPEQMFLTSWGEWWPKEVYELALDKSLQEAWSPSQEQIEKEEGVTA
ncbi:hypothetical protein GGR56DRAFT_13861 [Xylariaceae sp. FL0804]|nr:hypothetical protein GGR56DRAFT_13861 [Xylariaceae sp. FL0804]